jgi:DNA-binding MarR family transcriptional regulator
MSQMTARQAFDSRTTAARSETRSLEMTLGELNSRYTKLNAIRAALKARRQRSDFFSAKMFSDPAWDMLLELYAAYLADRRVNISRLAERSAVPMTTALRWMTTLQSEGLIDRRDDPFDKRRYFLSLTAKGLNAMDKFYDNLQPGTKLL